MPAPRPLRLTPKVRELVASDRQGRPPVGRLTAAQAEVVAAVARGADGFDEPVSAHRALAALAVGAPPGVAQPVLAEVAANRRAPTADRVAAARGLAELATPEAEKALLGRVRDRDARVQQAAVAGLGTFASPAALRSLGRLDPPDPAVAKQLALARALIAHRAGLDGPFLPEVPPATRRAGGKRPQAELVLRNRGPKPTAADRAILRGSTYGIEPAAESFDLRCGRSAWTVFLNRELGPSAKQLERLFERPWITAVLARWAYGRRSLATQYVALTRPVGGRARIEVARADGEIVYAGTADELATGLAFAVSDVERPATAPTKVTGRLDRRGIDLDTVLAAASRAGTRAALVEEAPALGER